MIVLLRHGRTASNAAGLLLGRADPELDDLGRVQAEAAGRLLGPVDRVITSPLRRTTETAGFIDGPVEPDERWLELDYGDWDERPVADVTPDEWSAWRRDLDFAPPNGESLAQLAGRVKSALAELAAGSGGETVVVVTHVSPIKAAVTHAMGAEDRAVWNLFVGQASISRIRRGGGALVLEQFNDTSHWD